MMVIVVFAMAALLLAAVGLYGVLSYQVASRSREIGIRMAMGATVGSVSRRILGNGMALVGLGLGLGLPASFIAGRFVQSLLFQVGTSDPVTMVGVAVFLGAIAAAACLVPAVRAAKIEPMGALRIE